MKKSPALTANSPHHELLCVNVGNRVKSFRRTPTDEQMREQTLGGAQWIPACLLEIVPHQQTAAPLSANHTTEMLKDAVRLPAENAGLIDSEGLDILGFRPSAAGVTSTKLVCCSLCSNDY
jgi:hypothetical protein